MATKALDPAFQGVAQKPGLEIWRIENFQPVPLPKSDYGKFYNGDSYIVLQVSAGRGAYMYDIHFWLGKDTSQDEAGTAAIKTVELDATLGGKAVQYREIQGHESDKFLSYFKPCIIPLEGGVASGFKKPEEEEFETRLYICHGKRAIKMKQVPFTRTSLNHDDVFILDTKDKIYQFNGANSNIQERAKALEVVQFLKDQYHGGTCAVAIVDDGKLQAESDSGEFWVLFGGFAPMGRKVLGEDDIVPEETPAKLYSINAGQPEIVEGELSKGLLENAKSYLLDCGAEVFVWLGRVTSVDDRKAACQAAEEFITGQHRPKATRLTRIMQGYEPHSFKAHFGSWASGSAASTEEGRAKVSNFYLKQQGFGAKGINKNAPAVEDTPHLLESGGKIEVWLINDGAKTPVAKEDIGKFYSGDCYIILYAYHSGERKEDFYLCYWVGKESTKNDQAAAAKLSNTMFNSLKGKPVLGRIFQGVEPPQFIAIFQPMVVLKGGLSSGYKKHVEEKGLKDETYSPDGVALIRFSGASQHNNKAVQVDPVAASLNTYDCFFLQTGSTIFIWSGTQSAFELQQVAAKVAEFLKPGATIKHTKEGTETQVFWTAVGGKQDYTSKKHTNELIKDPHMFAYSIKKGKFQVEEVYNFNQDDLLTEEMMILNTNIEVFVWVGQCVDPKDKKTAFEIGEKYVNMANALDGLSTRLPLYRVSEGNEPRFFTTYFSWDPVKTTVQGNSFQKKVVLMFGAGHESANKGASSNQDGPTQKASALAALSSALTTEGGAAPKPAASKSAALSPPPPKESDSPHPEEPQEAESEPPAGGYVEGTFTYEQVRAKSENPVSGIDFKRRESYLCDEEFESILEMNKEEFYKLPKWKQDAMKKKVDLF